MNFGFATCLSVVVRGMCLIVCWICGVVGWWFGGLLVIWWLRRWEFGFTCAVWYGLIAFVWLVGFAGSLLELGFWV